MEEENKMFFIRKNGFVKEMNLPSIPFQPVRYLVEKSDEAIDFYGTHNLPALLSDKKIQFQATKIITIIEYTEI